MAVVSEKSSGKDGKLHKQYLYASHVLAMRTCQWIERLLICPGYSLVLGMFCQPVTLCVVFRSAEY